MNAQQHSRGLGGWSPDDLKQQVPMCVLYCRGPMGDHCLQIVTGFFGLASQGVIHLNTERRASGAPLSLIDAVIDGVKVRYDLRDGYNVNDSYGRAREDLVALTEGVDIVFKRSFDPNVHDMAGDGLDIRPLGLNYLVTSKNVPFLGGGPMRYAEYLVRRSRIADSVLRMSLGRSSWVERFEASANDPEVPSVLFLARTWDPLAQEVTSKEYGAERERLNQMRASCIQACREAFGDVFVGGFARSEHALREFPSSVVPESVRTDRSAFLKRVSQATVCVATTGLHGSIGWKMAEYVAASRAIVSEPLLHFVPGGFASGRNYLEFQDPSTLVAAVHHLLDDKEARLAMADSNAEYYRGWVRPDSLVGRTIREALSSQRAARRFDDITAV